jgi:hypothetical protein
MDESGRGFASRRWSALSTDFALPAQPSAASWYMKPWEAVEQHGGLKVRGSTTAMRISSF